MKGNLSLVLLFVAVCCGTKHTEKLNDVEIQSSIIPLVDDLILINAPYIGRCELGRLIQRITKCSPKVIGNNFLFPDEKDAYCDSTLVQSILDSDKVVLVEGFEEGRHVQSHKKFIDVAFSSGLTGLSQNDDEIVDYYYRMIDHRGKWEMSFPFLLALQHDKSRAAELSSKITPKDYPVVFHQTENEFMIINHNSETLSDCGLLKDRIVIIGYLGPDPINVFQVRKADATVSMYGTTIIANIILDILKDL